MQVLLHNDDVNRRDYVVKVLIKSIGVEHTAARGCQVVNAHFRAPQRG